MPAFQTFHCGKHIIKTSVVAFASFSFVDHLGLPHSSEERPLCEDLSRILGFAILSITRLSINITNLRY